VALRLLAVIERNDELGALRREALQRVRQTGREKPEVTFLDVFDAGVPLSIDGGGAASSARHEGPLGRLVPVQLTNAARRQVHVDACNLVGDREVFRSELARPASILDPLRRDVE